jgi:hypothetical protein
MRVRALEGDKRGNKPFGLLTKTLLHGDANCKPSVNSDHRSRFFGSRKFFAFPPLQQPFAFPKADGIQLLLLGRSGHLIDFHKITVLEVIHARSYRTQPYIVLDLVNLALVHLALGSRVEDRLPIAFLPLLDEPPA